jgi:hypothetical protein
MNKTEKKHLEKKLYDNLLKFKSRSFDEKTKEDIVNSIQDVLNEYGDCPGHNPESEINIDIENGIVSSVLVDKEWLDYLRRKGIIND